MNKKKINAFALGIIGGYWLADILSVNWNWVNMIPLILYVLGVYLLGYCHGEEIKENTHV